MAAGFVINMSENILPLRELRLRSAKAVRIALMSNRYDDDKVRCGLCGECPKGVFVMSFIDDVINTTKSVAATAGKKTDEAVQFSKLKIKEAQLTGDVKSKFEKLGEMVYQMAKSGEKSNEEFDALIAELDECYEKLEEIDAKFDELKKEVTCPGCGAKTKRENNYCPKCGAKLPEPPAPETKEPAEEEEPAEEKEPMKDDTDEK